MESSLLIFIEVSGIGYGPYLIEQLREMWNRSQITENDRYWYDGMEAWNSIGEFDPSKAERKKQFINIAATGDGGWVINPGNTFLLTFYGVEPWIVAKMKRVLDRNGHSKKVTKSLLPIVKKKDFRCKQIEDYLNYYRPIYFSKIEELKGKHPDWETASEDKKEELLDEFKMEAFDLVDVCFDDAEILLEAETRDPEIESSLIAQTYFMSKHATERKKQYEEIIAMGHERKAEVQAVNDAGTCDYCRRMDGVILPAGQYPLTPFHLGCRCAVVSR